MVKQKRSKHLCNAFKTLTIYVQSLPQKDKKQTKVFQK